MKINVRNIYITIVAKQTKESTTATQAFIVYYYYYYHYQHQHNLFADLLYFAHQLVVCHILSILTSAIKVKN